MEVYDLSIIDGNIYIDGTFFQGNLYVKDGKVSTISKSYFLSKEIYNAKGSYVLPGFIDPHVHFQLNVGKHTSCDSFLSGSVAAAFGGITTFIDFLDPVSNSAELKKSYEIRRNLSRESVVDYCFHSTIANFHDSELNFIDELKEYGINSIKFFTTYSSSNRKTNDKTIDRFLQLTKEKEIMLLAHAENDDLINEGKFNIACHEENRPEISEITEVLKLAELTEYRDGKLYIVHISCGSTIEKLKKNYNHLLHNNLYIESCSHYFSFNKNVYATDNGHLYLLTPPLRSELQVGLLKKYIDDVDVIATDHCPFTSEEKNKPSLDLIPMGIGGVEHSFTTMFSMFGEKIIDKYTINPAKLYNLYPQKGTLLPGADADIVIYAPNEIIKSDNHSNCDYNLYTNLKGSIESTISKGKFVIKDSVYIKGNKGNYIYR